MTRSLLEWSVRSHRGAALSGEQADRSVAAYIGLSGDAYLGALSQVPARWIWREWGRFALLHIVSNVGISTSFLIPVLAELVVLNGVCSLPNGSRRRHT